MLLNIMIINVLDVQFRNTLNAEDTTFAQKLLPKVIKSVSLEGGTWLPTDSRKMNKNTTFALGIQLTHRS